ncbi:hypothetical protein [uncultured Algibacter sp.]|uniref:hypothetical protein n=1 Tax=uncultured Algibacter sp. TaxID=298659 RepID=UPI0030EEC9AD
MRKTEEEVIKVLGHELLKIENLYKSNCVNWKGKTKDTKVYSTEIIANKLIKELKEFDKISTIKRTKPYCRENHLNIKINKTNRHEENFAKQIIGLSLEGLGLILDYQVPLKNLQSDKAGKIDLISIDLMTKTLYLIELKHGNNNETLLRAILESYTYYKIVDKVKLKIDYFNNQKINLKKGYNHINPSEINVKSAVLFTPNCYAYKELTEVSDGKKPELKKLIKKLGVCCFVGEFEFNIKNISMNQYFNK